MWNGGWSAFWGDADALGGRQPPVTLSVQKRPAYYDPLRIAGGRMKRIVEGTDRGQGTLFPECLDDWAPKPAGAARRG